MTTSPKALLLVLDSVGIGELPDADAFNDVGAHTLGHIAETVEGFAMPHSQQMGLGNINGFEQMAPVDQPTSNFGKMAEVSWGKDTTTGHWEFVGLILDEPFRTFPDGFGPDILDPFLNAIGKTEALGNKAISGTVIIKELGQEHVRTGNPIVYTSADPVFQIAAHEDVVPLEQLYHWCEVAYDIVIPLGLSRVIARPFVGQWPNYERTANRKDFALPPTKATALDALVEAGVHVTGVGKIGNIYANRGISESIHTKSNAHGMDVTIECLQRDQGGLIFTNLVDFDAKFGHRRNPEGYAGALQDYDAWVPTLLENLNEGDLLIVTADHGNDPTYRGTDHTREYVPLLTMIKGGPVGEDLGVRASFADVGATIAEFFGVSWEVGESFLGQLIQQ